jgi:hypothetical protein
VEDLLPQMEVSGKIDDCYVEKEQASMRTSSVKMMFSSPSVMLHTDD